MSAWEGAGWERVGAGRAGGGSARRGHDSRGVGVLQEAKLVALAVGAQGLHDGQDPGRGERGRRVESWSQQESAEEARGGAGREGGQAGGGRGPPERQTLSSEKRALGPVNPTGGWRPTSEVCSFPTRAVPGWWPLGAVGSSCHPGSCPLAPACSSQGDGSLLAHYNADFCHLPPGQLPTSPGLLAPLVSNLRVTAGSPKEKEEEEEYNRGSRAVTCSCPSPRPPPCPAAPARGCWRLVEMEIRWVGDGRNEEQQGDGKPSPPLPVLSHCPCRGLSMSFPGAGRAQKGTRGCH